MALQCSMRGRGRGRGMGRGRSGGMSGVFRPIIPSCEASHYDGNGQFEGDQNRDQAQISNTIERSFHDFDNLGDGANEHMDEQLAGTQLSNDLTSCSDVSTPSKKKRKGRGKAIGISKPSTLEKRLKIRFESDRPVGPERNSFITKIGIWANDQSIFPYQAEHFDLFPEDKFVKVFKDANEYFDIHCDGGLYELLKAMCRRSWNDKRSKLFRRNYLKYKTYERALRHPPIGIDEKVWPQICDVFNGPKWKEMSMRNRTNRALQDVIHISGRTSFAQKKVDLREEKKREPFRYEIIESCFLRDNGSSANPATKTLTDLVQKAKCLPKDPISGAPQGEDEIFEEVLGPDCKRRKRGMGRVTTEIDNSLKAKVEELTLQLVERDKRDAEREKRDAERDKRDAERDHRENENQRLIQRLIAQVEALSHHRYGASFSQMPHQLYGAPNSDMPQQLQLTYSQHSQVPYQPLFSPYHQNSAPNQLQSHMTYQQPQLPHTRGGFTELLQRGINNNVDLHEKEPEVAQSDVAEENGEDECE